VRAFLERLEDYTEKEIPSGAIASILRAFFDVGDEIVRPEDERGGLLPFGNDTRIGRVTIQLLNRLDQTTRMTTMADAIKSGKAVSIIAGRVLVLGQQQGKYGHT
jgi:predicted KAP-like P-loop ATPase